MLLAAYGRIKVLKCLLDLGFFAECVDCNGSTPLMISIICGWDDCTKLLIERGANVYAVNNMGFSVRQVESRYSSSNIIKDTIARRRWGLIKASMKFLSLHSRAAVTANHPSRIDFSIRDSP
jgi:ankyrin repeat protein